MSCEIFRHSVLRLKLLATIIYFETIVLVFKWLHYVSSSVANQTVIIIDNNRGYVRKYMLVYVLFEQERNYDLVKLGFITMIHED